MSAPVDVLAVMHSEACALGGYRNEYDDVMYGEKRLLEARAAVAELIEAQRMAHDAMLLADWNVPGNVSERKHAAYLASAAALARVKGMQS